MQRLGLIGFWMWWGVWTMASACVLCQPSVVVQVFWIYAGVCTSHGLQGSHTVRGCHRDSFQLGMKSKSRGSTRSRVEQFPEARNTVRQKTQVMHGWNMCEGDTETRPFIYRDSLRQGWAEQIWHTDTVVILSSITYTWERGNREHTWHSGNPQRSSWGVPTVSANIQLSETESESRVHKTGRRSGIEM